MEGVDGIHGPSKVLDDLPWKEEYRQIAWNAFVKNCTNNQVKTRFENNLVAGPNRESKFLVRIVGSPKPGEKMPLVIALHGGGSGPKEMNDSQWQGMFNGYYKDAPEQAPYVYCALRAPNDEWNGFYDDNIAPLIESLKLAFVLYGNVDPNRVVITGASHGGYGTFVIATKMPHLFAAANASASAPTDGETQGENLRNLYFTWVNGATDTAYGRADRVQAFDKQWHEWKSEHGGFNGGMTFLEGVGHSVPDRDKPAELLKHRRNPAPEKLIWNQTDDIVETHYYLVDPEPKSGRRIIVQQEKNVFTIVNSDAKKLLLYIPESMSNEKITVIWGKTSTSYTLKPSSATFAKSFRVFLDPELATPYSVEVNNPEFD